jgi:hypothetical protein
MRNILEEGWGGRQRSRCCPTLTMHAHAAGHPCAHWRTISARPRPPTRRLSALWPFPTTCGIPPLVLVAAVGLRLFLVVVVVPVTRMAVSGVPDVGVGALEPPCTCACRRATSAASSRSPSHWEDRGSFWGLNVTSWVSRSRCAGILGVAVALLLQRAPHQCSEALALE